MNKIACLPMLAVALSASVRAESPVAPSTVGVAPAASAPGETAMQKLLRIVGISAVPAQRSEAGAGSGSIWIVAVAGGPPSRWTAGSGFRSPAFDPDGRAVYAMKGDTLLRIASPDAAPVPVLTVTGIAKLIGFDAGTPGDLIVLTTDREAPLAVLTLATGRFATLPLDLKNADQLRVVAQARGQSRVAPPVSISVQSQTRRDISRVVEWTDVMVRDASGSLRNLSACGGTDCSQPALSPDSARVAFIRAE